MRLELKGGEIVEGIPESVHADASNRPSIFTPPSEEHLYVDRVEVDVTIAGKKVLLQEVAGFRVALP